jgi:hypothetical protein
MTIPVVGKEIEKGIYFINGFEVQFFTEKEGFCILSIIED